MQRAAMPRDKRVRAAVEERFHETLGSYIGI
jgi:hypothetical protein